jgi:hypothetical protein
MRHPVIKRSHLMSDWNRVERQFMIRQESHRKKLFIILAFRTRKSTFNRRMNMKLRGKTHILLVYRDRLLSIERSESKRLSPLKMQILQTMKSIGLLDSQRYNQSNQSQ